MKSSSFPSFSREWASRLADFAEIQPGQRVLDVACGTGVLALEAANRVMPDGSGLDLNEGMLDVARRKSCYHNPQATAPIDFVLALYRDKGWLLSAQSGRHTI